MITIKKPEYYAWDRHDFLDWVGGQYPRVLDVGCGAGANEAWYRLHGSEHITGIELNRASAAAADRVFDRVITGSVEEALSTGGLGGPFDLIVCADVLEHLTDPWAVVAQLRLLATERTVLAVSVPNIRHWRALLRVAFGRGFEYEEQGTFDATHVRFFVRSNVERMLRAGGWQPAAWGSPGVGRLAKIRLMARRVTRGRSDEWLAYQIYARATASRPNASRERDEPTWE